MSERIEPGRLAAYADAATDSQRHCYGFLRYGRLLRGIWGTEHEADAGKRGESTAHIPA